MRRLLTAVTTRSCWAGQGEVELDPVGRRVTGTGCPSSVAVTGGKSPRSVSVNAPGRRRPSAAPSITASGSMPMPGISNADRAQVREASPRSSSGGDAVPPALRSVPCTSRGQRRSRVGAADVLRWSSGRGRGRACRPRPARTADSHEASPGEQVSRRRAHDHAVDPVRAVEAQPVLRQVHRRVALVAHLGRRQVARREAGPGSRACGPTRRPGSARSGRRRDRSRRGAGCRPRGTSAPAPCGPAAGTSSSTPPLLISNGRFRPL